MTILTGAEIRRQWQRGAIRIEPFDEARLNPNSYNFALAHNLRVYQEPMLDARIDNPTTDIVIGGDGYVLEAGRLYLGGTVEVLGGTRFAPTFAARSSIARLGLSIHLSSGLGDIGYIGQWTLQLLATHPVRVYPGMEIGQMMWWVPEGEITCYRGKYQGSRGPRASQCWRTLERDLARVRFLTPSRTMEPATVGAKAASLARLADRVPVPQFVVVPAIEFATALSTDLRDRIAAVFSDIRATVGASLGEDVDRLTAVLAGLTPSGHTARSLVRRLREDFEPGTRFAVRSSALGEDSVTGSHAGIYDSVLDVDAADIAAAVATVWRSYYSLPAVSFRVRAGDLDPAPRMAVIVQAMVEPDLAGIAMTGLNTDHPDQVRIEAVQGRADLLAAGVQIPAPAEAVPDEVVRHVRSLVSAARASLGCEAVDVEWAWTGEHMLLLQARPNTACAVPLSRSQPGVFGLYDEVVPADVRLGPIGVTYAHFVAKRGMAAHLATRLGIARPAAFVVYVPAYARCDWYATVAATLDPMLTGRRILLDANEFERQIVTDHAGLRGHLERLQAATPASEPMTVLVREYVTGVRGVITRRTATGEIYGEATDAGLLALNRGIAQTTRFRFTVADPAPAAVEMLSGQANLAKMLALTEQLERSFGPVTIEWVVTEEGALFYIDHTRLGAMPDDDRPPSAAREAVTLSSGRCAGRVLRVTNDIVLQRLSVAPAISISGGIDVTCHQAIAEILDQAREIRASGDHVIIAAHRPYAILAALVGHVDGFVFDDASLLCHLVIILREARIPAAVHTAATGETLAINGGQVHTLTTTGNTLP